MNMEPAILKKYERYISKLEREKEEMQQIIQAQGELLKVQEKLIQQLTELEQLRKQAVPE